MVKLQIVNVVATASLNQKMDFDKLREFKEIRYDSEKYGGRVAYFKMGQMQGIVSIFLSGKLISVGTKSEEQAVKELDLAKNFLTQRKLVMDVKLSPVTQNLVVTADFVVNLNLEKFSERPKVIYEPEQFPGAILRLERPFKASILIFASGKAVITGLKSSSQIDATIHEVEQLIELNQ